MRSSSEDLQEEYNKIIENRQKIYEDDEDEEDVIIPKDYLELFETFKQFVDDLMEEEDDESKKTPMSKKKNTKRKNAIKSKDKRKEEFEYQNESCNENSQVTPDIKDESQTKFMNDLNEAPPSNFKKDD